MRWELWEPEVRPEGPSNDFFFAEDDEQSRRFAEEDGFVCTWTVEADDDNTAMQLFYDHQGWGKWTPMED